jgi:hypothetical protein
VLVLTALVVAENENVLAPAATTTEAGTVTSALLELRFTVRPAGPAGPLRCTVTTSLTPPTRELLATVRPLSVAGVRFVVALVEALPTVAVIFTGVLEFTPLVFCRYQKLE